MALPASICDSVLPLLSAFVDGETIPQETAFVESHLKECADCASELAFLRLLHPAIVNIPVATPSDALFARIAAATYARPVTAPVRSLRERLSGWLRPSPIGFATAGTAFAAILAVTFLVTQRHETATVALYPVVNPPMIASQGADLPKHPSVSPVVKPAKRTVKESVTHFGTDNAPQQTEIAMAPTARKSEPVATTQTERHEPLTIARDTNKATPKENRAVSHSNRPAHTDTSDSIALLPKPNRSRALTLPRITPNRNPVAHLPIAPEPQTNIAINSARENNASTNAVEPEVPKSRETPEMPAETRTAMVTTPQPSASELSRLGEDGRVHLSGMRKPTMVASIVKVDKEKTVGRIARNSANDNYQMGTNANIKASIVTDN